MPATTPIFDCLIAFGANLGDEAAQYAHTLERLFQVAGVSELTPSQPHATAPVGGPAGQSEYLNAAIRMQTRLSITDLHDTLMQIELDLGRERTTRWGSRTIDLDLLLYGRERWNQPGLTVPHPRFSFRKFALRPALEIAGDMFHPACGVTIAQLWHQLHERPPEIVWVTPINDATTRCRDRLLQSTGRKHWKINLIDQAERFEQHVSTARLVAWGQPRSAELADLQFSGPQLELPVLLNDIEIELGAAIDAMND